MNNDALNPKIYMKKFNMQTYPCILNYLIKYLGKKLD